MDRALTLPRNLSLARNLSFNRLFILVLSFIVTGVPFTAFADESRDVPVEIVAFPKSGIGPMWVRFKPMLKNPEELKGIEWSFGDGQESRELNPEPHFYQFGKYNVILEATYKNGKKYSASICIDASSPG